MVTCFFFLENIYFNMRQNQQKTQQLRLCTKGRLKKRQQRNTKNKNDQNVKR